MAGNVKTYRHDLPSCKTVLKDGKVINFVQHLYATAIPKEQLELDELVLEGLWLRHASEDEVSGTAAGVTFTELVKERVEEELRKKILAEMVAQQAGQVDTAAGQLKPVTTAQLLGAAESNAAATTVPAAAPAAAASAKK